MVMVSWKKILKHKKNKKKPGLVTIHCKQTQGIVFENNIAILKTFCKMLPKPVKMSGHLEN